MSFENFPTKTEAAERFNALKDAIDAREAEIAAKRAVYEPQWAKTAEQRAEVKAMNDDVLDGMSMFDAKQQLAMCARMVGNVARAEPSSE